MAIYHCSVKVGSRSKGQSAIAAAAYRAGEKLTDHETGFVSDYTKKGGVVYSEIALCENAPAEYADRQTLWSAVHQIEKAKDARLWREIEVALPKEFSRSDQIETVRDFVKRLTDQGMCADWSLHDKGDGNPHAHIMLTTRSIKPDGTWAPKSRKVYDLDENGEKIFQKIDKTGRKQYKCHKEDYNNWNASERVEEWRAAWAECCNARLTERDRIDHRSYERQGIDQIPTVHEGLAARKIASAGRRSDLIEKNNEIKRKNSLLRSITAQLKAIGEEIKQLAAELTRERGEVINAGKQRIADLLARRRRAVDSDDRGLADGERAAEGRIKKAAPSATDRLIGQSKIERRAASSHTGFEGSESRNRGTAFGSSTGGADEQTDTAAIIRAANAVLASAEADAAAFRETEAAANARSQGSGADAASRSIEAGTGAADASRAESQERSREEQDFAEFTGRIEQNIRQRAADKAERAAQRERQAAIERARAEKAAREEAEHHNHGGFCR